MAHYRLLVCSLYFITTTDVIYEASLWFTMRFPFAVNCGIGFLHCPDKVGVIENKTLNEGFSSSRNLLDFPTTLQLYRLSSL